MPDIVVVGAGVFGAWTAHHLAAAGARVTIVDAYGPANPRASSGDESRIVRCGYGPDEIYSRFARRSLALWRSLSDETPGPPLFHPCGVLWLAAGEDDYTRATRTTLENGGYDVAVLDRKGLATRYPHLVADGIGVALLEPSCGVVMARRAVRALVQTLGDSGVAVRHAGAMPPSCTGRLAHVPLTTGETLEADAFVFACGPWLPKVFPGLLAGRIRPTRQVVVYFGPRAGDDLFGPERTPAWVDFPAGIYGVPDLENRGVKVGIDAHGPAFDPDHDDRVADADSIGFARAWLARRFPGLAKAPVVESRVCQYENTSTGDFLIDRHPEMANVWLVGGGSGHGFKHGPAVGEYVAELVRTGGATDARFALDSKGTDANRTVF